MADSYKVTVQIPTNSPAHAEAGTKEPMIGLHDSEPSVNVVEPPPSYDSIFGKVRKVKDESSGNVDFVRKIFGGIFCGTIACGVWIAFMLAVPVSAIVMGSLYLRDCPRQRYIPIYLVVFGCFAAVKAIIDIIKQRKKCCNKGSDEEETQKRPNPVDSVISCFIIAWFIAGSVWVYGIHGDYQSTHPEADDYCHRTLYLYSFWILTSTYIGLAIGCCCGCCTFIIIKMATS